MHTDPEQFLASLQSSLTLTGEEKAENRRFLEEMMASPNASAVFASASELKLDPAEKAMIRSNLLRTMDTRRGFLRRFTTTTVTVHRSLAAAVASLVLIAAGGGVAGVAAESAVPGDWLYPFKVNVSEPVIDAFVPPGISQARWALRKAERRVAEAEVVLGRHNLTAEQEAAIAAQLDIALSEAEKNAAALSSDDESAGEVRTRLQVILEERSRVIVPSVVPGKEDVTDGPVVPSGDAGTKAKARVKVDVNVNAGSKGRVGEGNDNGVPSVDIDAGTGMDSGAEVNVQIPTADPGSEPSVLPDPEIEVEVDSAVPSVMDGVAPASHDEPATADPGPAPSPSPSLVPDSLPLPKISL